MQVSSHFNVDDALSSILGDGFEPIPLPDNTADISRVLGKGEDLYKNLVNTAMKLRGGKDMEKGQLEKVALWLYALHTVEQLHPRYKKISGIDKALKEIVMKPSFRFPFPFPNIAEAVLNELEEANWGEEEVVESDQDDPELENEVVPTTANPPTIAPTARTAVPSSRDTTNNEKVSIKAAKNDPIYGSSGIMHDIVVWQSSNRKSHRISVDYHQPSSKVFGHNGIPVGFVFPLQLAAVRDGAHGATVGGISGNGKDGCFSIVVSGKYDEIDHDLGDTIYYSDSKALSNTNDLPIPTPGTDALRRSITTRRPVRVLRSSGGKWKGCPRAGLRYDGLYRVVSDTIKQNKLGGGYVQFKLQRLNGDPIHPQPEIDRNAPSPQLIQLIKRVKDGVTRRS